MKGESKENARVNDESLLLFGILTKETSKLKKNDNFEMFKNFRNYYFVISFNFEIVLFNFVGISGNVEDRFTRALEVFILPLS